MRGFCYGPVRKRRMNASRDSFLHRLMRPELVAAWHGEPLNADAVRAASAGVCVSQLVGQFSGFDEDAADEDVVRHATRWLLDVRVPLAAAVHCSDVRRCDATDVPLTAQALDARVDATRIPETGLAVSVLHELGVNCRYMALVRGHCKSETARHLLMAEMLARTFRRYISTVTAANPLMTAAL